ncbi:BspA family leucine-rich repeat surface protein [Ichthyobacterium seriolicida]|uniref:PKD domain-containing protein n=1 Tax=Ichthyobacterium seriolicida TaxID=242600 RepID=A0A1J1DYD2_9FLAO|nr:BspA family leucine-rich repeat surface protein [Ichthyobacterium seriolicida]BAV94906.1 hypothetical protein JBKA6_0893 [Ichthyobacterium seriolicida]
MRSKILLFYLFVFQIILFPSCKKEEKVENTSSGVENSSDIGSLLSFSLDFEATKNTGLGKDIKGIINSEDSTKISIVLPHKEGGLITKLVPTVKFVGEKIEPDPSTITDFTNPVSYVVTPKKGEAKTYTVTVSVSEPSSENKILSFSITKPNDVKAQISTTIDEGSSSISISLTELSYYDLAKITKIVPSIRISEYASISESDKSKSIDLSTIPSEAVKYTVTAENRQTKEYTVNITHELKKFVSKWKTIQSNKEIELPIYDGGDYDFTVDWGDGQIQKVDSHSSNNKKHTYTSPSDYTVTITGKIEGFNFKKVAISKDEIISITSWGDLKFGNKGGYFKGCKKLEYLPLEAPNLEGITNTAFMFYGAESFNSDISSWDVSKVTNMRAMFHTASAFNQDLNKWDTGEVTDMKGIFYDASVFNGDISNWNTSSVTDMSSMFEAAILFNQDLNNWDVSKVTNMNRMFSRATVFNGDIGKWDVSKVTDMFGMFYTAKSFNKEIENWDITSVTDIDYFLAIASSFSKSLKKWRVPAKTNISNMLWGTNICTEISVKGSTNCNCTEINYDFRREKLPTKRS